MEPMGASGSSLIHKPLTSISKNLSQASHKTLTTLAEVPTRSAAIGYWDIYATGVETTVDGAFAIPQGGLGSTVGVGAWVVGYIPRSPGHCLGKPPGFLLFE